MTTTSGEPALFQFDSVSLDAGGTAILKDITMEVSAGGITVLAGPSGAGKSTLLRLCNRLAAPTSGTVRYRGEDVATLDPLAHRRRVGMVFQQPTAFAGTVRENLHVADAQADEARLRSALERVGLAPDLLDQSADDLSGGEAQRMCLARTLLTDPDVLLMDEPTSALDPENRRVIERLTRRLADAGLPVIWVTHDLGQLQRLADDVVVLVDGHLADQTQTEAFLTSGDH